MRKYRLVAKKGEGTFSEVLKAQNVKDGKYHAIKCMKNRFESIDQVNNLREIQALRRLSPHEHVITLEEVLYDQPTGRLALVFELMDANLYELIRGRRHYLNPQLIKSYIWQLMKSLDHMHKKGIFHRDIKPENILIDSSTAVGRGLKLADFGSCRGIYSKQPYTEYISTRWYRAPECLLTDGYYGPEMDLWGAGCVMFEITSLYPLFPGSNEIDQVNRIHKVLGTPTPEILTKFRSKGTSHISLDFPPQKGIGIPQLIPHASPECIDLIVKLLKYDATERITAREAMRHPYFRDIKESERGDRGSSKAAANGVEASGGATENSPVNKGQGVVAGGSVVGPSSSSVVNSNNNNNSNNNTNVVPSQNPTNNGGNGNNGNGKMGPSGAVSGQVVQPTPSNNMIPKALPSVLGVSGNNMVVPINNNIKNSNNKSMQQLQQQQQQQQMNFVLKASGASLTSKNSSTGIASSSLPPIGGGSMGIAQGQGLGGTGGQGLGPGHRQKNPQQSLRAQQQQLLQQHQQQQLQMQQLQQSGGVVGGGGGGGGGSVTGGGGLQGMTKRRRKSKTPDLMNQGGGGGGSGILAPPSVSQAQIYQHGQQGSYTMGSGVQGPKGFGNNFKQAGGGFSNAGPKKR